MFSLVSKDIELDAVGSQCKPYLTTECVCVLVALLWCDMRCCSLTVLVMKVVTKTMLDSQTKPFLLLKITMNNEN